MDGPGNERRPEGGEIVGAIGVAILHVRNLSLIGAPLRLFRISLALTTLRQRSESKKPLPGDFLQLSFKFPHKGENG
jgi:hypothetical protein